MVKLVRDKIPEIMRNQGKDPDVRECPEWAYGAFLTGKLIEEAHEVDDELNPDLILLELADCYEVMCHIIDMYGFCWDDVERAAKDKREMYGGFHEGWLLENGLDTSS